MANRRMFCKDIVRSDAFLDMPLSAQCLYFHLGMEADDDGFCGNPKTTVRLVNASNDDLKLLIAKRFVLEAEDGVIIIKHWWMHNTIRKDTYKASTYLKDNQDLCLDENNSYTFENGTNYIEYRASLTKSQRAVNEPLPQIKLNKKKLNKSNVVLIQKEVDTTNDIVSSIDKGTTNTNSIDIPNVIEPREEEDDDSLPF